VSERHSTLLLSGSGQETRLGATARLHEVPSRVRNGSSVDSTWAERQTALFHESSHGSLPANKVCAGHMPAATHMHPPPSYARRRGREFGPASWPGHTRGIVPFLLPTYIAPTEVDEGRRGQESVSRAVCSRSQGRPATLCAKVHVGGIVQQHISHRPRKCRVLHLPKSGIVLRCAD